jgi:hypothetical protein
MTQILMLPACSFPAAGNHKTSIRAARGPRTTYLWLCPAHSLGLVCIRLARFAKRGSLPVSRHSSHAPPSHSPFIARWEYTTLKGGLRASATAQSKLGTTACGALGPMCCIPPLRGIRIGRLHGDHFMPSKPRAACPSPLLLVQLCGDSWSFHSGPWCSSGQPSRHTPTANLSRFVPRVSSRAARVVMTSLACERSKAGNAVQSVVC